jgi:hypothetical protein
VALLGALVGYGIAWMIHHERWRDDDVPDHARTRPGIVRKQALASRRRQGEPAEGACELVAEAAPARVTPEAVGDLAGRCRARPGCRAGRPGRAGAAPRRGDPSSAPWRACGVRGPAQLPCSGHVLLHRSRSHYRSGCGGGGCVGTPRAGFYSSRTRPWSRS